MNFDTDTHAPIILLDSLVENLATARSLASVVKAELEAKLNEFNARPDIQAMRAELDNLTCQIIDLEKSARMEAVAQYVMSNSKHPHPAVSIRITGELEYDQSAAIVWCESHLPKAVKTVLDAKFFEKHAKAVLETDPIPFVQVHYEPQAAISSDLSKFIPSFVPEHVGHYSLPTSVSKE